MAAAGCWWLLVTAALRETDPSLLSESKHKICRTTHIFLSTLTYTYFYGLDFCVLIASFGHYSSDILSELVTFSEEKTLIKA